MEQLNKEYFWCKFMSNNSVSHRIHDQLSRIIASTPPGNRLLSEPALAEQLRVSRATLREAMRTFETQGVIRRRQGSGTYVNYPLQVIESGLEVLESIETMAKRIGLSVSPKALSIERRIAKEEEWHSLKLDSLSEVTSVSRVMLAKNHAVAYLVDVLPSDLLSPEDLSTGCTGSILDLLLQRGEPKLTVSRAEINAVSASPLVARALGIQRGDVLTSIVSELFSEDGRVVDISHSYFLPGFFRFHVIRRVDK
jgi:GntR family transcriptional regulator